MCIGEKLALLQLKVVIIKLLNSFKIIAKEQSDAQKDDLLSAQFMAQLIQRDS
jgi:cytochrome P450